MILEHINRTFLYNHLNIKNSFQIFKDRKVLSGQLKNDNFILLNVDNKIVIGRPYFACDLIIIFSLTDCTVLILLVGVNNK